MSTAASLKNAVKYPTSIIVRGQDLLGIELAKSLLEQGGFVILIDQGSAEIEKYLPLIDAYNNLILMDYSGLSVLQSDLRRLDYVFYLNHHFTDQSQKVSTQEFLQASNYLDAVLDLTAKFDAKFLLSTSIKAHQSIVASKVIDLNYELQTAEKYSVYSELEIQRYSESLVREYQEKVGINTRIVRLGTLLGRGMEIDLDSVPIRLIIQALQGQRLVIPGDGLESDYYIHYLDAAYGIIKAQFAPNTKGQIYTLANEGEVTLLGFAYKLIELVSEAKEIYFDPDDHSLPPIKLYKPAINLTSIGWAPRISFERALSQTVDFLKSKLSEVDWKVDQLDKTLIPIADKKEQPKSIKDKVLDFFFISNAKDDPERKVPQAAPVNTEGALARLIAERKNQEKARKGSIILANNKLREALQKKPERTPLQRLDRWLNDLFYRLKQKLNVLKNMTLTDFAFWSLGIIAFVTIYLILVAPILRLSRSLYFSYSDLNSLQSNLEQLKYNEANLNITSLKVNLRDAQDRFSDLEYLFTISGNDKSYSKLQTFMMQLQQYITGYENITKALIPLQELSNSFNSGFVPRLDGMYMSVELNNNYNTQLNQMYANRSLLGVGIAAVESNKDQVLSYLADLPEFIKSLYEPSLNKIMASDDNLGLLQNTFEYLPLLSGKEKARYYLLIIQDEQRFTPSGGSLVGYYLIKMQSGAIVDISAKDFNEFKNISPDLSDIALKQISLVNKDLVSATSVDFFDLDLIYDKDIWFKEVEEVIELNEGVAVDMSVALNLQTLATLSSQGIVYKQAQINESNFIEYLNDSLQGKDSSEARNDLILRLTAAVLEQKFNQPFKQQELGDDLSNVISDDQLRIFSSEPLFIKFLSLVYPGKKVEDTLHLGMVSSRDENILTRMPEITLAGKITVNEDGSSDKELSLNYDGQDIISSYFCSATPVKNWSVTGTELENYSQVFDLNDLATICAILLPDDDFKYGLSYQALPFEKALESGYNYEIEVDPLPGALLNYDLEFKFASSKVEALSEGAISQSNGYLYKGSSYGPIHFSFKIK
jgi:nucleoside-diphosphate-sugar epimerase